MRSYFYRLLMILSALSWALQGSAQVPVVEAGSGTSSSSFQNSPAPASNNSNEVVVNLYLQLEELQREVQNLRGIIEEQGFQVQRMQTEQRDRYLDLDRRLSALSNPASGGNTVGASSTTPVQGGSTAAPVPQTGTAVTSPVPVNPPVGTTAIATGTTAATGDADLAIPGNEQELYRTALNLLLEESEYEQSIALLQQYVNIYPNGRYITNAYYWQGEAYILISRFNQASTVFMKVVNDYPNDPKAAGALLKLGVAYDRMGNRELARQTWQSLSTRYPDANTENAEAQKYLRSIPN